MSYEKVNQKKEQKEEHFWLWPVNDQLKKKQTKKNSGCTEFHNWSADGSSKGCNAPKHNEHSLKAPSSSTKSFYWHITAILCYIVPHYAKQSFRNNDINRDGCIDFADIFR